LKIRQTPRNGQRDGSEHCDPTLVRRKNVANVEVRHGWIGAGYEQRHPHDAADALPEVKITAGGELKRHFGNILNKLGISARQQRGHK
jgi:hypothetical protein